MEYYMLRGVKSTSTSLAFKNSRPQLRRVLRENGDTNTYGVIYLTSQINFGTATLIKICCAKQYILIVI